MKKPKYEFANILPVTDFAAELREWYETDRNRRGGDDPVVMVLGHIRKKLDAAIESAYKPEATLSAGEFARLVGLRVDTLYKQLQRGAIPGARKIAGEYRIRVDRRRSPLDWHDDDNAA